MPALIDIFNVLKRRQACQTDAVHKFFMARFVFDKSFGVSY